MSNIWANLLTILVGGLLVNNFVMNRFLGCCPFLGVSKQYDTAKGMSMAVIFVMTLASFITWFVQHLILVPLHLEYMQTIAFILVIAVLVGIVEMALKKISPSLYQSLGVYLSLIGVNRGRKKALKSILKSFRENYVPDRTMPIAIMTADAEKDGDWLEAAIRKEEGCADVTIIRGSVGPTIGSHVGPGMVGCAFWGKNRADKASLSDRIARRVRGQ